MVTPSELIVDRTVPRFRTFKVDDPSWCLHRQPYRSASHGVDLAVVQFDKVAVTIMSQRAIDSDSHGAIAAICSNSETCASFKRLAKDALETAKPAPSSLSRTLKDASSASPIVASLLSRNNRAASEPSMATTSFVLSVLPSPFVAV
jgi:hypothetical protein